MAKKCCKVENVDCVPVNHEEEHPLRLSVARMLELVQCWELQWQPRYEVLPSMELLQEILHAYSVYLAWQEEVIL